MPEPVPWVVIVMQIVVGVGLMLTGLPLALRRVRPNWFYGARFPATMADEVVWYEINASAGRDLIFIGATYVILFLAALLFGASWPPAVRVTIPIAFLTVALLGDAVRLWVRANDLLARRRQRGTP